MVEIITTIPDKCRQCYSCVRNCPVKAVKIENGQAYIIQSRCLNCGNCIKNCSQNAKKIYSGTQKVLDMLAGDHYTIACLAPSYRLAFYPHNPMALVAALKAMGFDEVWEVAVGAELVLWKTREYLQRQEKGYMSTACPAFVNLIEKHYPQLIPYLLPVVSPMIATGRLLRRIYQNRNMNIVFIGPCIAKKGEIREPQFNGVIDEVLTFDELKEMFDQLKISLDEVGEMPLDSPECHIGKAFPLSGSYTTGIMNAMPTMGYNEYFTVEGKENCIDMVNTVQSGKIKFKFVDVLFCRGCIDGPKIDNELYYYQKKQIFEDLCKEKDIVHDSKIRLEQWFERVNLNRTFSNKQKIYKYPTEEEIQDIMRRINKYDKSDELNCGACGYNSCREKAIAVYNGIAEIEMCLPYLLGQKNTLLEKLSLQLNTVNTLNNELSQIIESSYDGLVITDEQGRLVRYNKAFKELVLKDDKASDDYFSPSIMVSIKERRQISMLEKNGDREFLVTSTPIFDQNGNLIRVVSNLRDIHELMRLKVQLEEQKYFEKMNKNRRLFLTDSEKENIVANSVEFGEVLKVASSIAKVDSTVLILGESGTGKEVVARFIHNMSKRKRGPFVVVNCAAIPESLLESELFGYESGAFTGAKNDGKKGLFELADGGTIFLDEIGELPLSMQAKLLQVIQEKRLMRLGGTRMVTVDVRIIAATNRDLQAMVKEGAFRADLYYRLNVIPIQTPPLRERKDDIIPLAYFFLERFNKKYGLNRMLSEEVKEAMLSYDWPGNVRELENLIERLVVTCNDDVITYKDLPDNIKEHDTFYVQPVSSLKQFLEEYEKRIILDTYKKYKNTYKVAEVLGINQSTAVRKIKKYIGNAKVHD